SWLRSLARRQRLAPKKRNNRRRLLQLEQLEDRTVPTILDLSTAAGLSVPLGGAVFTGAYSGNYAGSTGSGRILPFLRVQQDGIEQGFNTEAANPVGINPTAAMDDKGLTGSSTPVVQLGNVPVVVHNGILYYEFLLDAHQAGQAGTPPLVSLDE